MRLAALVLGLWTLCAGPSAAADLRVGAAAVNLEADDSMVISGGIGPRLVSGQEGQLRAVAVVLEQPGGAKLALVGCDVLFVSRQDMDAALEEIEQATGIPFANVLINASHTHHAPSTTEVHGYQADKVFCERLRRAVVEAVKQADARLAGGDAEFVCATGQESTVGGNSRLLLADGSIWWIGSRDDAVRTTGPFDSQLPVLGFRAPDGRPRAVVFNHSTHPIGTREGNLRSPSFYGLAAQELEPELGGTVCYLGGASGSTHNITGVSTGAAVERLKAAVKHALAVAPKTPVGRLAAIKRPFTFTVRRFDEAVEDEKVASYCQTRSPGPHVETTVRIFREMRSQLAPQQGETRQTWIQAMALGGEVAIVGVPAEYFTGLGMEIKRRSPFRHTLVAALSNDWIGYLPDREAHKLGGYQTWMGLHSYAEIGTGERMVEESLAMLAELKALMVSRP